MTLRRPRGDKHDFTGWSCSHWRCAEANGWQCAACGHYFDRAELRMDADSEVRCRIGRGHEAPRRSRRAP